MTDIEKLKALLHEFGVPFEEYGPYSYDHAPDEQWISVRQGAADNVVGYPGFFTDFEFDAEGKFLRMGAGE